MTPQRRMRPGQAAARGAANRAAAAPAPAAPARRSATREEVATGSVRTSTSRRKDVYDETDQQVELLARTFEEGQPAARVRVGAGMTINLGNYETLRIDCSVEIPCLPTELEEAYEIGTEFISNKLEEEQVRWLGEGNTRGKN